VILMSAKPNNQSKRRRRNKNKVVAAPALPPIPKSKKKKIRAQRRMQQSKQMAVSLTTPLEQLVACDDLLNTINVPVSYDLVSFQSIPLAAVSAALTRGAPDPYAVYQQFYSDIQSIAAGLNGEVPVRLSFYNDILGVLAPKTVPMGTTGVISYNINPTPPGAPPGPLIIFTGGYIYYMYVPGGTPVSGWATQKAPPGYSPLEISEAFASAMQVLSKKVPHLRMLRDVQLSPAYLKDVSAFARNSPYYGSAPGNAGAPFSSTECEVNTRSKFFGVLIPFSNTMPRASRALEYTSGDPISNFGLGLWPDFKPEYYLGAVPPIYKFIDIDEILYSMMVIWQDAVIEYCNDSTATTDTIAFLLEGMGVPWSTFRIMLRQQLLWVFSDSAVLTQGMSAETSSGGFQQFLCGSNCYPANPLIYLELPGSLNENIRMLRRGIFDYHTKNFNSERNKIIYIPVLGAFKNTVPINISVETNFGVGNMFLPEPSEVPDIFDGTFGSAVADFNSTEILQEAIAVWNGFMDSCKKYMLGATQIGGASEPGSLLQFTRYVTFTNISDGEGKIMRDNKVHFKRPPRVLKQYISRREKKVQLERKLSNGKIERFEGLEFEQTYNPPDSTIFVEYTTAVSGSIVITDVHKSMFPQLILPVIELVANSLPTQTQFQTSAKELFLYVASSTNNLINSRAVELGSGVQNNVKGLAGEPTEWAKYVSNKSASNQGGFLGNLFTTIGSTVGAIIPEVGAAANGLGAIANSLNI